MIKSIRKLKLTYSNAIVKSYNRYPDLKKKIKAINMQRSNEDVHDRLFLEIKKPSERSYVGTVEGLCALYCIILYF